MWEEIVKAIPVYFSSMIKFIFGPIGGYAAGLTLATTVLTTVLGMMTVVLGFTYFGNWLKRTFFDRYFKNRKRFTVGNRRFVNIWRKYGMTGVAALTPILLTPIGGTLLALSSGSPKEKIILYMFVSAVVWSIVLSSAVYFFGHEIVPEIMR
jgi:membrane protein DedA with SNARE-associated domain